VKVKDLIWREPVKISSNATVSEAIEKMLKKGIRALIVEPKGENETFGILTVRDIVYKVIAKGKNPRDVKVEEIATRPVVTIDSNWSVRDAARLMAIKKKKISLKREIRIPNHIRLRRSSFPLKNIGRYGAT